jgi:hypothetical protein
MSLIRKQTLKSFQKMRNDIKKLGGDVGDRTNYHENDILNLISAGKNVFDKHVVSFEDFQKK